jgi:hypothetical protein
MASDILATLDALRGLGEEAILHAFLARVTAWQQFMREGVAGVLGPEAEIGLFGELTVLHLLLREGYPAGRVVASWNGPLDTAQDFFLGQGAIEVKSTLAPSGFPAKVTSLEQLDDSERRPLFVAAVRLSLDDYGLTLPGLAALVRDSVQMCPATLSDLDSRLLHAGLPLDLNDQYVRRFRHVRTTLFPVTENFPRLTRANVVSRICKARYEIDLDNTGVGEVPLSVALAQLEMA